MTDKYVKRYSIFLLVKEAKLISHGVQNQKIIFKTVNTKDKDYRSTLQHECKFVSIFWGEFGNVYKEEDAHSRRFTNSTLYKLYHNCL